MIKIEIEGVEDLIKFINLVKSSDLNDEELRKLTNDLNESADILKVAEQKQGDSNASKSFT